MMIDGLSDQKNAEATQTEPAVRRILLIEDELSLVVPLTDRLESEGYIVEVESDGLKAEVLAISNQYDLIILDIMLPGKSGFDVCRDLRLKGIQVPILMLTARTSVTDKVLGLKLGADDYLTKPFEMVELLARVESLMRRAYPMVTESDRMYRFGNISIDFPSAEVMKDGEPARLSAMEFRLLGHLIKHRGMLITRDELMDAVWGYKGTSLSRTVDVHIASLRRKLEANPAHPQFILTVHRQGYRFVG